MENYSKGKNIDGPMERNSIPIPNLPEDFIWIQVKGGTKMTNVLQVAIDAMKGDKVVVWSGSGPAVNKVISCAEIIKRNFKDIHQFNKLAYIKNIEEWEPKLEGLDKIIVRRDVPAIHIVLSKVPINSNLPGYQSPENDRKRGGDNSRMQSNRQPRQRRIDPDDFSKSGLRSSNYKEKRQYQPSRNES